MKLKAILIDDEPLAISLLTEMLSKHANIEIIHTCNDGFEGLKAIQELKPDLLFLDIQMPKITGIELLELIPEPPKVIFTTAYDEYAIKAFEINATDYLLKPYAQERLDQSIERLFSEQPDPAKNTTASYLTSPESANRVVVKDSNTIKIIPTEDIYYIEAAADYVKIHTQNKFYIKHSTMHKLEDQLPQHLFLRSHRSYLVNTQHLHKVELYEKGGHCIILRNKAVVPVSKTGYQKLKAFLG